jgi:hypothetical protein
MRKLFFCLGFLAICAFAFCQIDTAALHQAANSIPAVSKYWPVAAKIFCTITTIWAVVSEILPFLPTKVNGIIHGIAIALGLVKS